ncbi:MAG: hypothetical protein KDC81_00405 [Flavobacteriaceae bacterium]|nr:hypothetical protein [Flavobacteriaceae bacterium]
MGQQILNFPTIKFGDDLTHVKNEINPISSSFQLVENKKPNFPLAKDTEVHLIANEINLKTGKLDKVAFTFADGKLTSIEAIGNIRQVFLSNRNDAAQLYMGYQVYVKDLLFIDIKNDKAWILTPEAAHVGIFTWSNPLLEKPYKLKQYRQSVKKPSFIKMGSSIESLLPKFEARAIVTQLDTLNGKDPNAQFQINAYGIEYAGFPRKFEARFGDGELNKIWILTGKEEEDRIRKKLIKLYGKPIFVNDDWEFFEGWSVGLRKDIPEVLFVNEQMSEFYKKIIKNDEK